MASTFSELTISSLPVNIPIIGPILVIIPSFLLSLIYRFYIYINPEGHPPNRILLYKEYDFIIVGAGSAGSVVASRLSENYEDQVLLLEAGGDENEISDIPGLVHYLQLSDLDWQYKTEPQDKSCLGFAHNRCNWPRGKVLGGSSVLNYMIYVRGNRLDYDAWRDAGNYGWGFDDVLPYFKKSEDNKNPTLAKNTEYHSTGGYLTVSEPPWRTPLAELYMKAGVEMGYKNIDYNSRSQTGFMIPQGTLRKGSRCSTSKAFLRPVGKRSNLHIAKHSFVTKIIIDPKTKKATGVKFHRYGKIYVIKARKEVILSAGSINSAQLLMLSGIGPKEHLESHGIEVIKDLPVGRNLQDHIAAGGLCFIIEQPISLIQIRYENLWATVSYVFFGKGPETTLGGVEGLAFVNTKYAQADGEYPDVEFHLVSGTPASDGGGHIRKAYGFSEQVWRKFFLPITFHDAFNPLPKLLRPKSKGTITLRSANPFIKPIIEPNYLDHEDDVKTLIEGLRLGIEMGRTETFRKLGAKLHDIKMPGCEDKGDIESDDYLECLTRHFTATIYHPVGTAKMGPVDDGENVVDPELRVYGIEGLRVIDGSIMPNIVSGNTNAPIIMIGEKGSDLIKQYWSSRSRR